VPKRQGEAALEATSNHQTRDTSYRLRVSDVHHFFGIHHLQLKEEGDNPTRVYGMEYGGAA
jgi:hypothetical protein